MILLGGGEVLNIHLAYERLLRICTFWGLIGHDINHCKHRISLLDHIPATISLANKAQLEDLLKLKFPGSLSASALYSCLVVLQNPYRPQESLAKGKSVIPRVHNLPATIVDGISKGPHKKFSNHLPYLHKDSLPTVDPQTVHIISMQQIIFSKILIMESRVWKYPLT